MKTAVAAAIGIIVVYIGGAYFADSVGGLGGAAIGLGIFLFVGWMLSE